MTTKFNFDPADVMATAGANGATRPEQQPPTAADIADAIADAGDSGVIFGAPFSPNLNLRYLLKTGLIERLELTRYLTTDAAAHLEYQYLGPEYIKHNVQQDRSSAGYIGDELVFLYIAPKLARVPENIILQAETALGLMKWHDTESSHGAALRDSGGWELNFGWRVKPGGRISQFRPTETQEPVFMGIWPLLDRIDGTFSRVLPQIWRGQILDQRSTGFVRTATKVSSFTSVTCLWNAPSGLHLDARNSGFVVMTAAGAFKGGEFLLPEFAVSIDVARSGVLVCSTEKYWHGNFQNVVGTRYSLLGFFSEKLKAQTGNGNEPELPVTGGEIDER